MYDSLGLLLTRVKQYNFYNFLMSIMSEVLSFNYRFKTISRLYLNIIQTCKILDLKLN